MFVATNSLVLAVILSSVSIWIIGMGLEYAESAIALLVSDFDALDSRSYKCKERKMHSLENNLYRD